MVAKGTAGSSHCFLYAKPMQTVLTIAGFDPSSGAGVTAGLHGLCCAWTVWDIVHCRFDGAVDDGGTVVTPVEAEIVHDTLDCLQSDLPLAGIKIGMLATAANVAMVADFWRCFAMRSEGAGGLDPVVRSSSGKELLDKEGVACCGRGCFRWWIG